MTRIISRLEVSKAYPLINKKLASQRSLNFSKITMQRIGYLGVLLTAVAFLMVPPISASDDVNTKLQELQELQNHLKTLLEEQEPDDTSLTPSNVMKLKVKEDKGIRGIAFLKIDLGIKEKARDNGVASVVYTPNFDPVANSRGLTPQLVTIIDPDNYLNHENLELTWQPVECIEGSLSRSNYCMEFSFGHEFLQAPEYDIIGLTVVDSNRNVSYSYFND